MTRFPFKCLACGSHIVPLIFSSINLYENTEPKSDPNITWLHNDMVSDHIVIPEPILIPILEKKYEFN